MKRFIITILFLLLVSGCTIKPTLAKNDEYLTEAEALTRAKELGCTGAHKHDSFPMKDYEYVRQVKWMPCETHEQWSEITK